MQRTKSCAWKARWARELDATSVWGNVQNRSGPEVRVPLALAKTEVSIPTHRCEPLLPQSSVG